MAVTYTKLWKLLLDKKLKRTDLKESSWWHYQCLSANWHWLRTPCQGYFYGLSWPQC